MEKIFDEICRLIKDRNSTVRTELYPEEDMVVMYGSDSSALHRARRGMLYVEEMNNTVAEHHSHWRFLNYTIEMLHVILDGWDKDLNPDDIEHIKWAITGLQDAIDRIEPEG